MRINNLNLTNITCFTQETFKFNKVNVFYGPDGSGKSTIKDSIELLITGKCSSREESALQKVGCVSGVISADIDINGNTRMLEKNFFQGSVTTKGLSQQKLQDELKVTKPALELLADVWKALRNSEKDLTTLIQKALNPSLSKEQLVDSIVDNIAADYKVWAREFLSNEVKRSTSDIFTTVKNKIKKAAKEALEAVEYSATELASITEKLALIKNVNLDKVKLARSKIEITNQITNIKSRIEALSLSIKERTKELDEAKSAHMKAGTAIDMVKLNTDFAMLNKELNEATSTLQKLPVDSITEKNLPCKWFGICQVGEDDISKIIRKTADANKEKSEKLKLVIANLNTKISEIKDELSKAQTHNWNIESCAKTVDSLTGSIESIKSNMKMFTEEHEALVKTIPNVEDGIGDALFTMAEEAENLKSSQTTLVALSKTATDNLPKFEVLNAAITATEASLKTTKESDFVTNMIEDLKILFNKPVVHTPEFGYMIDSIPVSYLSMSQKQRVGLAMQHTIAKISGINIMIADDLNIITDFESSIALINKAISDGMCVFLFSSLEKSIPTNADTTIFNLTPSTGW